MPTVQEAERNPQPQIFKYAKPNDERPKTIVMLSRTDISYGAVQVVRKGGENNLHSHTHLDGFWFVLGGRAKFYTDNDEVIAELGKHEGILIPRGYRYWFEAIGPDELELLDVHASDKKMKSLEEINADRNDDQSARAADLGRRTVAADKKATE